MKKLVQKINIQIIFIIFTNKFATFEWQFVSRISRLKWNDSREYEIMTNWWIKPTVVRVLYGKDNIVGIVDYNNVIPDMYERLNN